MKYYFLNISCKPDKEIYNQISKLLKVEPMVFKPTKRFPANDFSLWKYQLIETNDGPYIDFINEFMDLIEPNLKALKEIGIQSDDIDVWMIYEYDQQCAMEFSPKEMKRLSANGITLCIDCYQWDKTEVENEA